ncbi:MAG TPA: hypothetical protein VKT80_19025, partial [Chloroflexota bacterium]|nr:hypothetical protein [Chloroflexota bacterium]
QALAAAGVLSVGLGVGAVSGVFASPASQSLFADLTPVASTAPAGTAAAPGTPGPAAAPGPNGHWPGGFARFGRGPGAFLGPVATFLGISQSDLRTALQNGQTLAQVATAHGKTPADLKAFLVNQESARIDKLINTVFPKAAPGGPGWPGGPGVARGGFSGADVATFLGISQSDYVKALQSGQTPAQVAVAHGKTAADLKSYLIAQLKTKLDQAVTAGKLTSQQETDRLTQAGTAIDKFINSAMPARGSKQTAAGPLPATPTATTG